MRGLGFLRVDREQRTIFGVSLAQAVEALGHGGELDAVSLQQIVDLGNGKRAGVKSRYTHPGLSSDGMGKHLGWITNLRVEGDKAKGDLKLSEGAFKSPEGNLGEYVLEMAEKDPEAFGMSIVFSGERVWRLRDGSEVVVGDADVDPEELASERPVFRIDALYACDAVDEPAANRDGLFGVGHMWGTNLDAAEAYREIDELLAHYNVPAEKAREFALRYFSWRGIPVVKEDGNVNGVTESSANTGNNGASPLILSTAGTDVRINEQPYQDEGFYAVAGAVEDLRSEVDELAERLRDSEIELALAKSRLSEKGQEVVRKAMRGLELDELGGLIEDQRAVEAQFSRQVVTGVTPIENRVSGMLTGLDQIELATNAMFDGVRPPQGIPPLQGIRDLYLRLSGDYELTGEFHPERIGFAAITTATMPNLMANAMNKRVVSIFRTYERWWEPIVESMDAANLQDLRHLKVGGIGEMPTVAEGAAYQETSWSDDYETTGWTKKGHYIGMTLEAIDKDDTRKIMMAPRALAMSAYRTLARDVARQFTVASGAGPNLRDGNPWFHSSRSNIGTSAFSYTSVKATILAMQKHAEVGSGDYLGNLTYPAYWLVPLDLEFTALEILGTATNYAVDPQTSYEHVNILSDGETTSARLAAARRKLIVVPEWSDANNWAAMADPAKWPTLTLAYRFGREPEIFTQVDKNSGLMFTNDVMPIKVRWFYSLGPIEGRGVYKHNVA
jgi:hypothetical protein